MNGGMKAEGLMLSPIKMTTTALFSLQIIQRTTNAVENSHLGYAKKRPSHYSYKKNIKKQYKQAKTQYKFGPYSKWALKRGVVIKKKTRAN